MPAFTAINTDAGALTATASISTTAVNSDPSSPVAGGSTTQAAESEEDALLQQIENAQPLADYKIPEDARKYRFPTTSDESDWWRCPRYKWNRYIKDIAAGSNKSTVKNAHNQLRKASVASCLMETEKGVEAAESCGLCESKGVRCVLPVDPADGKVCAHCTLKGKVNCTASLEASEPVLTVKERLASAKGRLMALSTTVQEQRAEIKGLVKHNRALSDWNKWAFSKINELCVATGVDPGLNG